MKRSSQTNEQENFIIKLWDYCIVSKSLMSPVSKYRMESKICLFPGLGCWVVRASALRGSIEPFAGEYLSNFAIHAQGGCSAHDQQLFGQKLKNDIFNLFLLSILHIFKTSHIFNNETDFNFQLPRSPNIYTLYFF